MNMGKDICQELYLAVSKGNLEKVSDILSTFSAQNSQAWEKIPYLHCAQTSDMTELLISQKLVNINKKDIHGLTPLHSTITNYKDLQVIKVLISHGANVNATDYEGNTPLTLAIIYENLDAIKELIEHGADINVQSTSAYLGYSTSLCIAVRDYKECAKVLIKISLKKNFNKDFRKIIDLHQYSTFSNYNELSQYFDACVGEICHMKMHKLNNYFTVYELIKTDENIKPLFESYKAVEEGILYNYPIYQDCILPKIQLCIKRAELFNELRKLHISLGIETVDKKIILNHDTVDKIVEFLPNNDLLNFIKSFYWAKST